MLRQTAVTTIPRFASDPSLTLGCDPSKLIPHSSSRNKSGSVANTNNNNIQSALLANNDNNNENTNKFIITDEAIEIYAVKSDGNITTIDYDHDDGGGLKQLQWTNEIKELLSLAWPVSTSTISQIAMFNIDTAFLGHLGTAQLSGASLACIIAEFTSTLLYAPAYALNSLCSQSIGSGNSEHAGNWLQLSIAISSFMCIPTIVLLLNVRSILSLICDDNHVLYYAGEFGKYSILFVLPSVLYMSLLQYFQCISIVKPAMFISLLCIAINVALNQIYMYSSINGSDVGFDLGFVGSPLATSTSTILQLFLFFIWCVSIQKYHTKCNAWNGIECKKSFSKSNFVHFMSIVGPQCIGDSIENWALQIVSLLCATLSKSDVAAMSILVSIWMMCWAMFWGIGLATVVRSSYAIGNGNMQWFKLIIKVSFVLSVSACSVIAFGLFVSRNEIAMIFTSEHSVSKIVINALPICALDFMLEGFAYPASAALEAMSMNTIRAVIFTLCTWLIFAPLSIYGGIYNNKWIHDQYGIDHISFIWISALFAGVIRTVVIWIVLLFCIDWNAQMQKVKKGNLLKIKQHSSVNIF